MRVAGWLAGLATAWAACGMDLTVQLTLPSLVNHTWVSEDDDDVVAGLQGFAAKEVVVLLSLFPESPSVIVAFRDADERAKSELLEGKGTFAERFGSVGVSKAVESTSVDCHPAPFPQPRLHILRQVTVWGLAAFGLCLAPGLLFSGYLPGPPETPKRFYVLVFLEVLALALATVSYLAARSITIEATVYANIVLGFMSAATVLGLLSCLLKHDDERKVHTLHIIVSSTALVLGLWQSIRWWHMSYRYWGYITMNEFAVICLFCGAMMGLVLLQAVPLLCGCGGLRSLSREEALEQTELRRFKVSRRESH